MWLCRARRNDANILAAICISDNENSSLCSHAECDEPLLAESRVIVGYRDCVRVVKDWDRFGQTDAVLGEVQSGFTGFVPFKSHALIVCMFCAYTVGITEFAS